MCVPDRDGGRVLHAGGGEALAHAVVWVVVRLRCPRLIDRRCMCRLPTSRRHWLPSTTVSGLCCPLEGPRRAAAQLVVLTAYMCCLFVFLYVARVCRCAQGCACVPMFMSSSECHSKHATVCWLHQCASHGSDNSVIQAGLTDCVCSRCHSSPLLPPPCTQAAISSLALTVNRAAHHNKASAQQK